MWEIVHNDKHIEKHDNLVKNFIKFNIEKAKFSSSQYLSH